jgi:hypothetical protein
MMAKIAQSYFAQAEPIPQAERRDAQVNRTTASRILSRTQDWFIYK